MPPPQLECVNEEYQHYFICSPKRKKRKVKPNYFYDLPWDLKELIFSKIKKFRKRKIKIKN